MKATATQTNTFIYDAWNMVQESTVSGLQSHVSHFVWGLDLSGTLQGAGGVGGLLCWIEGRDGSPSRPFFPSYDANGNITDLVDTNGAVVAHYEYDPYGNTISQSGAQADANPFRFSSKYWDGETGFYYYGYRFYIPSLGRFLNRDPIGEMGGIGLLGYVENQTTDRIDILGLWPWPFGGSAPPPIILTVGPDSCEEGKKLVTVTEIKREEICHIDYLVWLDSQSRHKSSILFNECVSICAELKSSNTERPIKGPEHTITRPPPGYPAKALCWDSSTRTAHLWE
jgi:RHS repeat-associated protein